MRFSLAPEAVASGYRVASYETIGSTSTEVAARLRAGEAGALWVATSDQTSGRGRRGSVWQNGSGSLFASLGLRLDLDPPTLATLGFMAGVATVRALERCRASLEGGLLPASQDGDPRADGRPLHHASHDPSPPSGGGVTLDATAVGTSSTERGRGTARRAVEGAPRFALKWPNDVLADGAKLVGILLETELSPAGRFAVVGIGVNVVRTPEGLLYRATSLAEVGVAVSAADVFHALSAEWTRAYETWDAGRGFAAIRRAWLEHAAGVGGPVTVRSGAGTTISGTFDEIDASGHLILRDSSGRRHLVAAGDVHFGAAASMRPEAAA